MKATYEDIEEDIRYMTIEELAQWIIEDANTGDEKQVNESLHFGMGLYIWAEDAYLLSEGTSEGNNNTFTHLEPSAISDFLRAIYNRDGFIAVDDITVIIEE